MASATSTASMTCTRVALGYGRPEPLGVEHQGLFSCPDAVTAGMLGEGCADVVTDFQDIESHPGNRDFERVNALVCLGWKHTTSSSVVDEPSAEMDISDDNGYIWCNWVAGSLHSAIYEFHGNGLVVNSRTKSEADVSKLSGGIEIALNAINEMVDFDRDEILESILQELENRNA